MIQEFFVTKRNLPGSTGQVRLPLRLRSPMCFVRAPGRSGPPVRAAQHVSRFPRIPAREWRSSWHQAIEPQRWPADAVPVSPSRCGPLPSSPPTPGGDSMSVFHLTGAHHPDALLSNAGGKSLRAVCGGSVGRPADFEYRGIARGPAGPRSRPFARMAGRSRGQRVIRARDELPRGSAGTADPSLALTDKDLIVHTDLRMDPVQGRSRFLGKHAGRAAGYRRR